jgi:probable rRNA maturation factor
VSKAEINVFVENIHENFSQELDLREIIERVVSMTEFFLGNEEWVKKSCLNGYDFDSLCFDAVLCGNEKIHEINKEYRKKDSPTDIITFAIFADGEERFVFNNEINLGEIIISLDKTEAQARENDRSFYDELYFLFAHGILHLLGYDHATEETLCEMWDMQKKMTGEQNV